MERIRASFNEYFSRHGISLPDEVTETGQISGGGWSIRYVLTTDESGERCLDFLAQHRMTNMRHVRIALDGEVIPLDSIQESFSYRDDVEGDEERAEREWRQHNERVVEVLKAKGLV